MRSNLAALVLCVPLLLYIVYPLGAMLTESITLPVQEFRARQMGWDPEHQPPAAGLRRIFSESKTRDAARGTLVLSALSVLAAGAWGLALALLWARREFPGRRWFYALGFSPVLMPPIVGTLAFQALVGESGALWRYTPGLKEWAGPFARVLLVHTYSFGCFTYAYVAAALEGADSSREEAARSLGANTWRTFIAAVWPVVRAPLLAAALLTFMASAASFSAPYMLDNSARYLTVEIFNEAGDPGLQRALSVLLAAISLAALPPFLFFTRRGSALGTLDAGIKGGSRGLPPASARSRKWFLFASVIAAIPLLLPPIMAAAGTGRSALSALDSSDWNSLGRSLLYGAATALICVSTGTAIAFTLRRAGHAASLAIELAVMLTLALPGSSLAVALLSAFNGPSWAAFGAALGGTPMILILAYSIRTLALAVRPARAAVASLGRDHEDAAHGLGATGTRVFLKVLLPAITPALIAGGLLVFVTAAGEYVASMLLFAPQTQPASVRIDQLSRTDPHAAHALALCLMAACALPIVIFRALQRRRSI